MHLETAQQDKAALEAQDFFTTLTSSVLQQLHIVSGKPTTDKAISDGKTIAKDKTLPKADAKPKALPPAATPKQEMDNAQQAVVTVQEPKTTKTAKTKSSRE